MWCLSADRGNLSISDLSNVHHTSSPRGALHPWDLLYLPMVWKKYHPPKINLLQGATGNMDIITYYHLHPKSVFWDRSGIDLWISAVSAGTWLPDTGSFGT